MGCSTGGCSTGSSGGCNKVNTFDWLADIPTISGNSFKTIEVSFKNGARKDFFNNDNALDLYKGDLVVVKAEQGYDIGEVSLSGELVKMQMKKKKVKDNDKILAILRKASETEIEKLDSLRAKENEIMKMSRVIARDMKLNMKIGDVEFQGDGKKVTLYYTSEARVDFRELVKKYVAEFKVKIEMRQIGARQEAQRLGGVGSCGRELCCSSFLTEFKSVTTGAARYQQLSINSDKLSGQCGRLKCCLNYELETYVEAFKTIPKKADKLKTKEGTAYLRKTDIFKMEMTFNINKTNKYYKLNVADVKKVQQMNKKGEIPESLANFNIVDTPKDKEKEYDDLVGQVNLKTLTKKPRKKRPTKKGPQNNKQSLSKNPNQNKNPNRKKSNNKNRKKRPNKPKNNTEDSKS